MEHNSAQEWYRSIPSFTRTYCTVVLLMMSMLWIYYNDQQSLLQRIVNMDFSETLCQKLELDWSKIKNDMQYWRLLTSFLYLGEFSAVPVVTLWLTLNFMGALESGKVCDPSEILAIVTSCMIGIVAASTQIEVRVLGPAFVTALATIWWRLNENAKVDLRIYILWVIPCSPLLSPIMVLCCLWITSRHYPYIEIAGIATGILYVHVVRTLIGGPIRRISAFFYRGLGFNSRSRIASVGVGRRLD